MMRKYLLAAGLWLLACSLATAQLTLKQAGSSKSAAASCSQATTFIARASLTGSDATNYTNLICGMVTDGLITGNLAGTACGSIFDVFYIYATVNTTVSLLNICSTNFTGTVAGSPIFTAYSGYNAGGGSISTGFNPSTASSPNFVQNSAHMSLWSLTTGTDSQAGMGNSATGASGESHIFIKFTDNNFYARLNASTAGGTAISTPTGHLVGSRVNSTTIRPYQNGASLGADVTDTSAAPENAIISSLATTGGVSDNTHSQAMMSIGAQLSGAQVTNFYNRLRTYMTAVGVP